MQMRQITLLFFFYLLSTFSIAQKQLDSIYSYQFKNNQWEPTIRKVYTYGQNSRTEFWSGKNTPSEPYKALNYNIETYDPNCNNLLQKREAFGTSQDPALKTSTTEYERDGQCRFFRQSLIRAAANDTSQRYDYSNFDVNGNARRLKFYQINANNILVFNFEREFIITYTPDKKYATYIQNNVVNGVSSPWQKQEYKYIYDKIENISIFIYNVQSASWKLQQEFQYTYKPTVEVTTLIVHTTGTPKTISIDSAFLDSDKNIIHVATWAPIGTGFASNFKSDYYYSKILVDNDNDGFNEAVDCNDANAAINPNAVEVCDNIDNNCNGATDDGLPINTYYIDSDADGFGTIQNSLTSCMTQPPTGYITNSLDCNDTNSAINPNAAEVCDNIDNNCNVAVDDGLTTFTFYIDNDSDGYGGVENSLTTCMISPPGGYITNNLDCDDSNAAINPNSVEIANNGIDENCDGVDLITAIQNINVKNILVFPNPVNDVLNIHCDNQTSFMLNLYTITGKYLMSYHSPKNIILSEFENGIHIIQFVFKEDFKPYYLKVIVKH